MTQRVEESSVLILSLALYHNPFPELGLGPTKGRRFRRNHAEAGQTKNGRERFSTFLERHSRRRASTPHGHNHWCGAKIRLRCQERRMKNED